MTLNKVLQHHRIIISSNVVAMTICTNTRILHEIYLYILHVIIFSVHNVIQLITECNDLLIILITTNFK